MNLYIDINPNRSLFFSVMIEIEDYVCFHKYVVFSNIQKSEESIGNHG